MDILEILIQTNDASCIPFIREVHELGHRVKVQTDSSLVNEFCQDELIEVTNRIERNNYNVVISESFYDALLNVGNYILIPTISHGKMDSCPLLGTFGYWTIYQKNIDVKTSGYVSISREETYQGAMIDLMKSSLCEIIVTLARNEGFSNNANSISAQIKKSVIISKNTLNAANICLCQTIQLLLRRYFGGKQSLVKSTNYLTWGRLDGCYGISSIEENDINDANMFLLNSKPVHSDTLNNPDAILSISHQSQEIHLNLYSNRYQYRYFLDHLTSLINASNENKNLETVNLISECEHTTIEHHFNSMKLDFHDDSIIDVFSKVARRFHDKTAIVFKTEAWTYENLDSESDKIAMHIANLNLPQETPVILAMDRSPMAIASIFGILKSGCCYVPIDPSYPKERIASIIHDTKATLCLSKTDDKNLFQIDYESINTFWVDQFDSIPLPVTLLPPKPSASNLAYIIYTSGSTGAPKGVMIEHCNIVNLVKSETIVCGLSDTTKILNVASLGFDAAGWDIYGALLNGATLYIAPKEIHISPNDLHQFIKQHKITFATLTPAILALMPREEINSLQTLVVMGDVCPEEVMNFWTKYTKLFNGYGPTEATIGATMSAYTAEKESNCIGIPLHNYQAYVLDDHLNSQPIGITGEIYLAGSGLARGYFNNLKLTDERFIIHYFANDPTPKRLYKTGDLGYWNEIGELIFVGRSDHQVKIRGIRIELGEVEIILKQHAAIDQALVVAAGEGANKHLVAYVTLKKIKYLKSSLKKELQHYLKTFFHPSVVPQTFTILDSFPINSNGKIDRKSLPEPEYDFDSVGVHEEAGTYQEKIIQAITQDMLQRTLISIRKNIFELGVHSLIATQIVARINDYFNIKLSTKDIFEKPTIYELGKLVEEHCNNGAINHKISILTERRGPLTPSQQRLWFLHQLNPGNASYNLPFALELDGELNITIMKKALQYVIQKHESFRLVFCQEKGIPFQKAIDTYTHEIPLIKISEEELDVVLTNHCQKTFILTDAPPLSIYIFEINEHKHVLFFVKHNIITDAWSEGLIINDLTTAYESLLRHNPLPKDLPLAQIIDAAEFIRNNFNKSVLEIDILYWEKKLQAHIPCDFPTDMPRPTVLTGKGYRYHYVFSNIQWSRLRKLAQNNQSTTFILLISALNLFMAKYTGQTDIILGTALAGRDMTELEQITGFFVNTLPLRTSFEPFDTFYEILNKTRKTCFEAYQHQNVPFEWIVEVSKSERFLNKNPLFQIMAILQNADEEISSVFGDVRTRRRLVQTNTSMFDMVLNFSEKSDSLIVEMDFSTELFDFDTIKRLIHNFENLLGNLESAWTTPFNKISTISQAERKLISSFEMGHFYELKHQSILEIFENIAYQFRYKTAIKSEKCMMTYGELWSKSIALSRGILLKLPTKPKISNRIGIFMDRSENMILAILATLKSGNTYVPIDPDYPKDRVRMMLEDSQISLVITDQSDLQSLDFPFETVAHLLALGENSTLELPKATAEDLAYILYTSGSTGRPKGVMVTHKNLLNLAQDFVERLDLKPTDKFLSITTISFDIFGLELFCPLLSGAELVICHQELARNPVYLVNYVNEIQPSMMQATPTMWSMIVDHLRINNQFTILCGGEALSLSLLQKLQKQATRVFNLYGPTETTIWSTAADLTCESYVHIGRPISNTSCYIYDDYKNPVPIGSWGDLYIGGEGVSKGYWHRADLNEAVFIEHDGKLLYKTGDRAKWEQSGNLIYGGRTDMQVKLRGHRIELSEIESVISMHSSVSKVVVHLTSSQENPILVAYVVMTNSNSLDADELRNYLVDKLPSYMLPAAFVQMESIPLTPNKKIDRKKLPIPEQGFATAHGRYVSPENELETLLQNIWQSVMAIQNLSVVESFFSLGGHSLHIPQIVSKINLELSCSLTVRDFILHSTIKDLASFLKYHYREQVAA